MAGSNGPIPGSGSFPAAPSTVPKLSDFSSSGATRVRDVQGRYAKGGWGFQWQGLEQLLALPEQFEQEIYASLERGIAQLTDDIEVYAKLNAPWEDKSGDARAGLKAIYTSGGHRYVIYLGHSVYYGMYLERSNGAAFAIIVPTLRHFAPQLAAAMSVGGKR